MPSQSFVNGGELSIGMNGSEGGKKRLRLLNIPRRYLTFTIAAVNIPPFLLPRMLPLINRRFRDMKHQS